MGNRAVITTPDKKMGVYLHWNGGREAVLLNPNNFIRSATVRVTR